MTAMSRQLKTPDLAVQRATAAFFADQQRWVTGVLLEAGLSPPRAGEAAQAFLAALEGALLLARARTHGAADPPSEEAPGLARARKHDTTAAPTPEVAPALARARKHGTTPALARDEDLVRVVASTLIDALL